MPHLIRYFFFKDSCEPKKIEFRLWGLFLKNPFSLKWHSFETWFMFLTFWVSRSIRKSGFVRCWQGTLKSFNKVISIQINSFANVLSFIIKDTWSSKIQFAMRKMKDSWIIRALEVNQKMSFELLFLRSKQLQLFCRWVRPP